MAIGEFVPELRLHNRPARSQAQRVRHRCEQAPALAARGATTGEACLLPSAQRAPGSHPNNFLNYGFEYGVGDVYMSRRRSKQATAPTSAPGPTQQSKPVPVHDRRNVVSRVSAMVKNGWDLLEVCYRLHVGR